MSTTSEGRFTMCPHCGHGLRDGANFCDNCGRQTTAPSEVEAVPKDDKVKRILITVGVVAIVILIATAAIVTEQRRKSLTRAAGASSASAKAPDIHPEVRLTPTGVSITNKDSFDYGSTKIVINMTNFGGGPTAYLSGISAGKLATIPYGEFSDGTERFNFNRTKILTIMVRPDIQGRNAYALLLFPNPSQPGVRAPEK
jgi:hypothetical protein